MNTFTGALCASGVSCLTVIILRLLLPGRGGLGSLFSSEQDPSAGTKLGGVFMFAGIVLGMLAGGGALSGNALFSLLITAGAVLIGFVDDLVSLQDKHGEGIVPWLKALLFLLLTVSASVYLAFSEGPGRIQFLPVSCASADFRGWYMLLALPLLLGRVSAEKKLLESSGNCFAYTGSEAVFWCFAFCLAAETGALQWSEYRNEFGGLALYAGAVAGALLGISVFNPFGKALCLGRSGYFGIAVSLSLMALCSGWLILLPLAALWPFICGLYALVMYLRNIRGPERSTDYLFPDYFTAHGMTSERLHSLIRWTSLLGILAAAVLYTL